MKKEVKLKVGKKFVKALIFPLQTKNLIIIRGSKGYIMCGYLNLAVADKFGDLAVKVVGVNTIEDVLKAKVFGLSKLAKKIGIFKGQPIKEVLKVIA
ncbi:MAG: DUF1805 domain-containing protein [Candidatus Omnitrophica bacterium]|nr:DUF1805 domain-containing protein [Candidatus Omnitrophota bacterium]MCM8831794.1 DUF1805 domain-containing protein [Candidatus Omnitrophota bacterium]